MTGRDDADMTGQDPLSSAAEGDHDPGSAALAEAGAGGGAARGKADPGPSFAEAGPPPEAADDTLVSDAVPETDVAAPGLP